MYLTRSSAQPKPPSTALKVSSPLGGSPRSASTFWIPHSLSCTHRLSRLSLRWLQPAVLLLAELGKHTFRRASSSFSAGMLVQVRCIMVSTHTWAAAAACVSCAEHQAVCEAAGLTMFCILSAISSVSSAVEPPAPQVMSQKVGP